MPPNDFPPWQTVYWRFRGFVRRLLFLTTHDIALMPDRERVGRAAQPTAGPEHQDARSENNGSGLADLLS